MIRAGLLSVCVLAAPAWAEEDVQVPSGTSLTLYEVLSDIVMGQLWLRFRYVAPRIGKDAGAATFDVAAIDIDWLCQEHAVPYVTAQGLQPERIVVSMSDQVLEFGASDPGATQFFGAYRLESGRCIWEEF